MKSLKVVSIGLVFAAALLGCTSDAFTSGDPPDSGDTDGSTEGSTSNDSGNDSSKVGDPDTGTDAGQEAGAMDSGIESGTMDSGIESGTVDSGTVDSGTDSGVADSGADAADASCFTVPSGSTGVNCDSCMKSSPCSNQRDICIAQCGPTGCADAWEGFLACIDLNPDAGGTLCASTWLSGSLVESNLASCGNTFCSSQCQ